MTTTKFLTNIILLLLLVAFTGNVSGQIYIDTGHPDVEKLKEDENDIQIYEEPANEGQQQMEKAVEEGKESVKEAAQEVEKAAEKAVEDTKKAVEEVVEEPKTQEKPKTPTTTKTSSVKTQTTASTSGKLSPATDDLPPKAEPGKCYARCYVPDEFKYVEERVIDKPVTYKSQTIPAVYKTVFDTVLVTPELKRTEMVPAEYEYVTEEIMIEPSSTKWVKKLGDPNCLSANPEDCQVMCLVEMPAKYKTVKRKVMKTPSYEREITTPAEYKVVSRRELVQPAKTVQNEIAATYKKVMKKVKVKDGGYQEWREVLCGDQLTNSKIRQIQTALKAKGYDPGPIDSILGPQTREALTSFQLDKGLPTGNMNMETMKALGVE